MKKLLFASLILLFFFQVRIAYSPVSAESSPIVISASDLANLLDHNGPWLPGDITSWPSQNRALNRGYFTYCFDAVAAQYPNFKTQAAQVVAAATSESGIGAQEVTWGPDCDVRNVMPPDDVFVTAGGQGAAALIYYWTDPVTIYYRRALGFSDWKSAMCHEGLANSGHLMGLHEEYDDVNFRSNGRYWTCMDFGTGVWQMPDWDRDRIIEAWNPDAPAIMGLIVAQGVAYAYWNDRRADGGLGRANGISSNSNATRMSFAYSHSTAEEPTWVGFLGCGAEFGYCFTDYQIGFRGFDAYWRGCLWGRAENVMTYWRPQSTPGNSPSGYWQLFGCW